MFLITSDGMSKHKNSASNVFLFFGLHHLIMAFNAFWKFQVSKIRHGSFWGSMFDPGIFVGFVGKPRDFSGFWFSPLSL